MRLTKNQKLKINENIIVKQCNLEFIVSSRK